MPDQPRSLEEILRKPFTEREEQGWLLARVLVETLIRNPVPGMRCHEIARALGRILKMDVQDGFIASLITGQDASIEHSWLWTISPPAVWGPNELSTWSGNILDPWVMGGLPRVQLLQARPIFGHFPGRYWPSGLPEGVEINQALVEELENFFVKTIEEIAPKK